MPDKVPIVKVTSSSFSKNEILRRDLCEIFPNASFIPQDVRLSKNKFIEFIQNADAVILSLDPINEEVLSACPRLKIVSKFGVGLDNIDQEACQRYNVALGWTGGVNRRSVAELALFFMIGLCRNAFQTALLMRKGVWEKDGGVQLSGRTIGLIGVGNIGKEVADLLTPFHCKILVNDVIDQSKYYRKHGLIEASKEDIYAESEIISLHVPLTSQTHHMIGLEQFSKMKPNAFLVNTSRGETVNQNDLKKVLQGGKIGGAAIDVYESEPPGDLEFLNLPNLVSTPHIAGNAKEAVLAMGRSAINHLCQFYEL